MKFIDLFAGLGGFHLGLSELQHECVFASEIDQELRSLYFENFGLRANGDIKLITTDQIPSHDILCAGFPCQPFSKAGFQEGMEDMQRGTLFHDIARILRYHKPKYFILENVPNLKSHDQGRTWKIIIDVLQNDLQYSVCSRKLSPHQFGIPQIRERIFIVGSKTGLDDFTWPEEQKKQNPNIRAILDKQPVDAKFLPERERQCLDVWQEFLDRIPKSAKLPSFPIWTMEFGATYPYENLAPFYHKRIELDQCLGAFGKSLYGMAKRDQIEHLPKYARDKQKTKEFPRWKKTFIRQNRELYSKYKNEITPLLPAIQKMPPSWQKFEWNCQGATRKLDQLVIQFRSSGIRVKRPNYSPSLVASTSTQIPIIGWEKRYITKREGARLQSLNGIELPASETSAFKALGNAVNAQLIKLIAARLISEKRAFETKKLLPIESVNTFT